MFNFGFCALEQFKSRLCEWPQYCALLLQIPTLKAYPQLLEFIETSMIQGRNVTCTTHIVPTQAMINHHPSPVPQENTIPEPIQ